MGSEPTLERVRQIREGLELWRPRSCYGEEEGGEGGGGGGGEANLGQMAAMGGVLVLLGFTGPRSPGGRRGRRRLLVVCGCVGRRWVSGSAGRGNKVSGPFLFFFFS